MRNLPSSHGLNAHAQRPGEQRELPVRLKRDVRRPIFLGCADWREGTSGQG
jgi:hypothetical protein